MRIVLSSDGSVELLRGERITRGQDLSRRIYVEWNKNESPIDLRQITADNMAVQLCITRPDGEQSGWYSMVKIDAEEKYYHTLQAWDTAVAGIATCQIRWYDVTLAENDECVECGSQTLKNCRQYYPSAVASFIVDNGKIAQPLNLSSENYNDIVLEFITPLSNQAFRKYNVDRLPDTIKYSTDGEKTSPALYYNFTHEVQELDVNTYKKVLVSKTGCLISFTLEQGQVELFITDNKIYTRKVLGDKAEIFSDLHSLAVQANPNEEATAELEKVKINGVTYSIPEGDGVLTNHNLTIHSAKK